MRVPGGGSIFKRSRRLPDGSRQEIGPYYIQYCANGKVFKEASHTRSYPEAEALLRGRIAEKRETARFGLPGDTPSAPKFDDGQMRSPDIISPGRQTTTLGTLLSDLLDHYTLNSPGTLPFAEPYIKTHLLPAFKNVVASELSTDDIERYKLKKLKKGFAPSTINHSLTLLRRAFNLALRRTPPKVERVPWFPKLKEENVRQGFFEREDYERLRASLPEPLRPVLTFAYYTGARLGEVLSLRWDQVDFAGQVVRLYHTKNGEIRTIPIGFKELLSALTDLRAKASGPWVFTWLEGSHIKGFPQILEARLRSSGMSGCIVPRPSPYGNPQPPSSRCGPRCDSQDLRA
jgi:hypothetical protein